MPKSKIANDEPVKVLAQAASTIYLVAGSNIVLGLTAFLHKVKFLQALGFGIVSAALGVLFLGLGVLAKRRSPVALILAVLFFFLEGVVVFVFGASNLLMAFSAGTSVHTMAEILQDQALLIGVLTFWFGLTIAWPIQMLKGIGAIKKLKQGTPGAAG
jgi:hypothetical protein